MQHPSSMLSCIMIIDDICAYHCVCLCSKQTCAGLQIWLSAIVISSSTLFMVLSAVACKYLLAGFERRSTTLICRAAALLLLAVLVLLWLRLQRLIHRSRCDLRDTKYWQVHSHKFDRCVTVRMLKCSHTPLDQLCLDADMSPVCNASSALVHRFSA